MKVRFLEGYNSREVLDFNLFLSPFDVWIATCSRSAVDRAARLSPEDNSCTAPQFTQGRWSMEPATSSS